MPSGLGGNCALAILEVSAASAPAPKCDNLMVFNVVGRVPRMSDGNKRWFARVARYSLYTLEHYHHRLRRLEHWGSLLVVQSFFLHKCITVMVSMTESVGARLVDHRSDLRF